MVINNLKLTLIGLTLLLTACETLRVNNSNGDVGVLVDGGPGINDLGRVGSGVGQVEFSVSAMDLAVAPGRNEAISFGYDRAPTRSDMPWTSDVDDFSMSLGNELAIPITVWIVQGPFIDQRDHAYDACATTASIWDTERMGVRFNDFQVIDATSDPDINDAILNSVGGDNRNWDDFSDDIGFINGRINVYWINTVNGSTTTGWSDFGSRIVMGADTGDELLVHEIGHALSLRHPANCAGPTTNFNFTNIMWSCSSSREYVSEGQVFRAHFNSDSSINNLYGARSGQATVSCNTATNTAECPALRRRLWTDGTYPAN